MFRGGSPWVDGVFPPGHDADTLVHDGIAVVLGRLHECNFETRRFEAYDVTLYAGPDELMALRTAKTFSTARYEAVWARSARGRKIYFWRKT